MDYFKIIETSLKITAYQTQKIIERKILKGIGWPKPNPIRDQIFKYSGSKARWIHSPSKNVPYAGLLKGLRYSYKDFSAIVNFSFTQKFVDQIEKEHSIQVTPQMRRMFGAGRPRNGGMPGINFLPLKTTTKVLKFPARKIFVPQKQIEQIFDKVLRIKLSGGRV